MDPKNILSDYSPLYLDLPVAHVVNEGPEPGEPIRISGEAGSSGGIEDSVNPDRKISWSASDLVRQSFERNHTPFQCTVLLVKNAFEGHMSLTRELMPADLLHQGTFLVDLRQDTSLSLVYDFFDQIELYGGGLRFGWEKLAARYNLGGQVRFEALLHFILAHQLFKLPVSALDTYDVQDFAGLSESQEMFFLRQYHIGRAVTQFLGDFHLIRTVNTIYNDLFREAVLKIRSREDVLSQLQTKLLMANDPDIKSEQDLERQYFSFLVATRMKHDEARFAIKGVEYTSCSGEKIPQQFLLYLLKQLYRGISKNCRETHTLLLAECGFPELKELFMEASEIYNEAKKDECDFFIHYYMLLQVLGKAVLFRQARGLPVTFSDFTGLQSRHPQPEISMEFIEKMKLQVADRTARIRSLDQVSFKMKNVCDEELAILHREYLEKQIEFLEECIREVLDRIRTCIDGKSKKNTMQTLNT